MYCRALLLYFLQPVQLYTWRCNLVLTWINTRAFYYSMKVQDLTMHFPLVHDEQKTPCCQGGPFCREYPARNPGS